jgi:hypothetical protein
VERGVRDRAGWPRREERASPDKILIHAAILARMSANWVAYKWASRRVSATGKGLG